VLAVITEREPVQRILAHLGVPTENPPLARARDPAARVPTGAMCQIATGWLTPSVA
jgi:hypothetical protein